ncbi:hypothetical protein IWW57_000624 [Coemansia sp. S610]|nr:hypothetical protein IWW57_000624 [Coemansia sp. S610]KAJ2375745.1 hypothetical protein H4S02_008135 [Coemansia sp. RSA 2611]KAJ2694133.1 hypothetical protein H4218_005753 [Coemansia sp. IMI 209128]
MALNTSALKLARFYLYLAAIVLIVVTFIVDAVSLASLKGSTVYMGFVYTYSYSSNKGAAGFTMFVTIVSLFLVPAIAFGSLLVQKGLGFIEILNRVLFELIAVSVLGFFWFVAACVMAAYAGLECGGSSICSKFSAATAFTWLTFVVMLALSVVVGLMLHVVRTSGGNIKETLTHAIDGEYVARAQPAGAAGLESHPYPGATAGGNSYYNSSPAVNMPIPGDK